MQSVPEVGLIQNICGGAEFVCDVGQWHIADAQPAELVNRGCQRPDRRIDSGCGGVVQGRQKVQQGHEATVRQSTSDGTNLDGVLTGSGSILMRCAQTPHTPLTGSMPRSR